MTDELVASGLNPPPVRTTSDARKLATGAMVTLIGKTTGGFLLLVTQIVMARYLGPQSFGLYGIGWTILGIIEFIAPLGLEKSVIRFSGYLWNGDYASYKSVLLQSLGGAIISGSLLSLGLVVAAPWLADQVFEKPGLQVVFQRFALAFPLMAGLNVAIAATRVSLRMKYAILADDVVQPAVNLLLIGLLLAAGRGVHDIVVATVCSFGIALILAVYFLRRLFPEVFSAHVRSRWMVRELLMFSMTAWLAELLFFLIGRIDRLLIGYFRPGEEVGIYQAVSQATILFGLIGTAFAMILSPLIVDLSHRRETKRLGTVYRVATKWSLYLSLPVCLTICWVPRQIIGLLFGPAYEAGWLPMVVLTIGQCMIVAAGPLGLLLTMTGHQKRWLTISGAALCVSLVLSGLLIPRWGMTGAAIATAASLGGLLLWGLLEAWRTLAIWPYDRRYVKGVLATGMTLLALRFNPVVPSGSPVLSIVIAVSISTGVFVGSLLLLGLDSEDRELVRELWARVRQSLASLRATV
jgi:O-antigen/teichoic acid export membrane protein